MLQNHQDACLRLYRRVNFKTKKKKVIKKDIQLKNVMQFMVYDTVHMQKFNHLVINIM